MTGSGGAGALTVAPREIHDLVERCCRVAGRDPGIATLIATRVTALEIDTGSGVERFVEAFDDDALDALQWVDAVHGASAGDPGRRRSAHRVGVAIDHDLFAALERRAARFLVAEAVLDADQAR